MTSYRVPRPIKRLVAPALREALVQDVLDGKLTKREAAQQAGVTRTTVQTWLKTRGVKKIEPPIVPFSPRRTEATVRARLVKHLLAGEITRSEAAVFAGITVGSLIRWPELKGTNAYSCRDRYLRKLLPDLQKGAQYEERRDVHSRDQQPSHHNQVASGGPHAS